MAKEFKSWTAPEFLLLSPPGKIPSKTLRGVLAGWTKPAGFLSFNSWELPESLSLFQLLV